VANDLHHKPTQHNIGQRRGFAGQNEGFSLWKRTEEREGITTPYLAELYKSFLINLMSDKEQCCCP
jgi:hypothetical protein